MPSFARSRIARLQLATGRALLAITIACGPLCAPAAAQTGPVNGVRPADMRVHAITQATVVPAPGVRIENASIIIRDGVIVAVGADAAIPPEARVWPAAGMTVYPGLIDAAVMIAPAPGRDIPTSAPGSAGAHWNERVHPQFTMAEQPALEASLRKELRGLGFTIAAVYPPHGVLRGDGVVVALADERKDMLVYEGAAALACGFDYGGPWETAKYPGSLMGAIALLRQTFYDAQWHVACADVWRAHPAGNEPPLRADALAALRDVVGGSQPLLFDVSDEHNALRAAKIIDEFKLKAMLLGSGYEFRRVGEVAATKLPVIVPLQYPDRPKIASLLDADRVTLRDMQTWEQAPTNPRRLVNAGVTIALTTHRLKNRAEFPAALRKAIQHGLSEDAALAALTIAPARLLGLDTTLGTIAPGKAANLVIVEGSLFRKKPKIRETWINGRRFEVEPLPKLSLVGKASLRVDLGGGRVIEVPAEIDTIEAKVTVAPVEGARLKAKAVTVQEERVSFVLDGKLLEVEGFIRFSGVISGGALSGAAELPDGRRAEFSITPVNGAANPPVGENDKPDDGLSGSWSLTIGEDRHAQLELELDDGRAVTGTITIREKEGEITSGTFDRAAGKLDLELTMPEGKPATIVATIEGDAITGSLDGPGRKAEFTGTRTSDGDDDDEKDFVLPPEELTVPFGEYGLSSPPTRQNLLINNATIWTCGPEGVIERGSLLVVNGKIERIFRESPLSSIAPRLDAGGKHITPGLIDCHSHTGIDGGVNEWTQADTAEVRIGDVIDPDDINWYRELAGGLTACNQLHGSANPIGGQNSVVKLKWGGPASAFPIASAVGGIKFALGENVIRPANRYPKTRMGVETFIRDAFTAARDYLGEWKRHQALPANEKARAMPPRRDLELDALVEILNHQRIVHCHSYRQDEILMLIRVADDFGFTIGTFQHVLEGYKVAEAIAKHGAGASSFSDWWGYKVEVQDAIPHNGAILHGVGALVSFNSDSSELARRMNLEAAKAVRHGGVAPDEALKFVTINPARQLRIDDRVGSLEVGKDADFVIWSGHPLSGYSRCEQTWIEGARHFELDSDRQLRETVARERERLVQKILRQAHGKAGKAAEKPPESAPSDKPGPPRFSRALMEWMEEQVRLGRDPCEIDAGSCGGLETWSEGHQ